MRRTLFIDLETYSDIDIGKYGAYRYVDSPAFCILLLAYGWDEQPIQVVDLAHGEVIPDEVAKAIKGEIDVELVAHNAAFERLCLRKHFNIQRPLYKWTCTMIQAARCGLPLSLADVGKALGLKDQKMTEGKKLIQLFCCPNKQGRKVHPDDYPEQWETFCEYCRRDVEVERDIYKQLYWLTPTSSELQLYNLDQLINDKGAEVDTDFVTAASRVDAIVTAQLQQKAIRLTGLANPSSNAQAKGWIEDRLGIEVPGVAKGDVQSLEVWCKEHPSDDSQKVLDFLDLRKDMAKTSNAKYAMIQGCTCSDGRVHGMLQHHGTRTGRWAGRLVQLQNLPQNHLPAIDEAREMVKAMNLDSLELCYGDVRSTLSQLIRTAFVAPKGHKLVVCDFSAIEARVLAWLAGEQWVLDVFKTSGKIYEATAAKMYGVRPEEITKTDPRRQKGKVCVLALGYQGGVGALEAMGGAKMGLSTSVMEAMVKDWRNANPHISKFWTTVEKSFIAALQGYGKQTIYRKTYDPQRARENEFKTGLTGFSPYFNDTPLLEVVYDKRHETVYVELPSGRKLCYFQPKLVDGKVTFMGLNQTTRKWERTPTYGGKLTENITQAVARDCLADTMLRMRDVGFIPVFHVHDEVVIEAPEDGAENYLTKLREIFAQGPEWAQGLPLKGEGYITPYYLKD